jgi:uncharacterized ferritin-like protein (DUF455 family)
MYSKKFTKHEFFALLQDIVEQLEVKKQIGKSNILDRIFPNEVDKKSWRAKYYDLLSNERGLSNAEFFYNKIIEAYRLEIENMDTPTIIDATLDEKVNQLSSDTKYIKKMLEEIKGIISNNGK